MKNTVYNLIDTLEKIAYEMRLLEEQIDQVTTDKETHKELDDAVHILQEELNHITQVVGEKTNGH